MSQDIKEQAAFWSIIASASLTIGKLVAGVMSGSLALISEAGHALLDTGATILTYFAVKASDKPADEEHHFGHGKIEAMVALVETSLLLGLAGVVAFEGIQRLKAPAPEIDASPWVFGVLIVSIVVDFTRWRQLSRIAKETRSDALAADALHFSSDLVSSALVLIGLIATLYGYPQADALAALGVSLFIAVAGYELGRRTIDTLTDVAPIGVSQSLQEAVAEVGGVVKIDHIRVRPAGAQTFAEIGIGVARTASLERVAMIKDNVIKASTARFPELIVTVTTHPLALDEETVLERVLLIAAKRRVPVHHVTVQTIGETLSISLDLEIDARMSLGAAHAIASKLETAIRTEFGEETEVDTHIEPLTVSHLDGSDCDEPTRQAIETLLQSGASQIGLISDVHNVRVRQNQHGLMVNYHCRFDPSLDVATVHSTIDRLEQGIKHQRPDLARIVSHTEPLRPSVKSSA
jgi:cation diffusion facilitator family transporter